MSYDTVPLSRRLRRAHRPLIIATSLAVLLLAAPTTAHRTSSSLPHQSNRAVDAAHDVAPPGAFSLRLSPDRTVSFVPDTAVDGTSASTPADVLRMARAESAATNPQTPRALAHDDSSIRRSDRDTKAGFSPPTGPPQPTYAEFQLPPVLLCNGTFKNSVAVGAATSGLVVSGGCLDIDCAVPLAAHCIIDPVALSATYVPWRLRTSTHTEHGGHELTGEKQAEPRLATRVGKSASVDVQGLVGNYHTVVTHGKVFLLRSCSEIGELPPLPTNAPSPSPGGSTSSDEGDSSEYHAAQEPSIIPAKSFLERNDATNTDSNKRNETMKRREEAIDFAREVLTVDEMTGDVTLVGRVPLHNGTVLRVNASCVSHGGSVYFAGGYDAFTGAPVPGVDRLTVILTDDVSAKPNSKTPKRSVAVPSFVEGMHLSMTENVLTLPPDCNSERCIKYSDVTVAAFSPGIAVVQQAAPPLPPGDTGKPFLGQHSVIPARPSSKNDANSSTSVLGNTGSRAKGVELSTSSPSSIDGYHPPVKDKTGFGPTTGSNRTTNASTWRHGNQTREELAPSVHSMTDSSLVSILLSDPDSDASDQVLQYVGPPRSVLPTQQRLASAAFSNGLFIGQSPFVDQASAAVPPTQNTWSSLRAFGAMAKWGASMHTVALPSLLRSQLTLFVFGGLDTWNATCISESEKSNEAAQKPQYQRMSRRNSFPSTNGSAIEMNSNDAGAQRRVPCKASDILQLVELDYGVPKVAFGPHQTKQHGVVQAPFVVSMSVRPVKDGWLKLSDSVDCSTTLAPIVEWPAHARDVTFLPNATSDNAYVCFSTGLEIVEVPAGNSGAEKARDVFFFAACNPLMPIVFKPATPEPTPEPSPGPTPSPTPNPTPNPTPEPSPSPTPEPTPSPTPAPATPTPTTPMPTAAPTPAPPSNDSAPSSAAIAGYTAAGIAGVLIIVVVVTCVLRPAWWRTAAQEVSVRLARIGMGGGGSDAHGGDEAFTALSAAQLRVVRRIGSGAWGVVYLCERVRDGTQLAVKHIPCTQVEARVLALREIATLQSVQGHPNVVAVHEMLIREFWVDDNQADSAFGSHGRDSAASRPQQQGRARAYSAKPNGGRRMPIGSEEFSTWTGHTSSALETTILNNTAVANGSSGAITMTLDPKVQMSRAHSNILDGADTLDHQHSNGHSSPSATRRRQHLSNGHGSPARNRGHQKTPKSSPPPQGGTRSNGHDTPLLGETTPPVPVREAADIDAPIVAAASGSEKDRKNHTAVAVNGSHDVLKESPSSARQLKDSAEVSQRRLRRGVNATDSDSASARSAGSDNDDDTAVVAVDASANLVSGVNVDEKSGSEESFGETAVREHQDAVHDGRPTVRRFLCIVMRYYPQGDIMHWLKAVFPVSPQATQHESLASDSDFFAPIRISCQDRAKVGSLLPEQLLFAMTVQLSGVLAYLHRRGILHCDIKPENILVADRIPPFYLNNTATTGNAGSTVPPVAASPSSSPAARPEQPRSPQSAPGAAQGQQFDSDPLQPTPGIGDDRKASSLNGGGDGVQSPEGSPRVPPRANTDVPDTNQGGAGPGRGERERSFSRVTQDGSFASDTRSPCAPDVPASPAADPNASSTTEIAGDCSNTRTQVAADAGLTAPAASTVGNRSFAQSVTALKKEKPLTPASCHQVRDYFVPIVVADFGVAQVMQRSGRAIKSTVRNRDAFLSKDAAPAKSRAKSNEGVVAGRQRSNSAAPRRSSMGGGDHRQQQQQHQQQQPHLARRGSIDDGDESELRTEPRDSNRPQRRSTATATAAAGSRSCGASPSCGVARAPAAAAGGGENKNRRMSHSRTSLHDVDFSDPEADDDDNGRHHNYDDDEDDDDDDDPTGPLGFSLPYLSPECVANNMSSFSSKNDVWAMGCVIHALATKRVLFPDLSRTYLFEHARRQTFRADVAVSITCLGYSDAFAALVVGMLEPDPAKRLSAAQVHSHFSTVAPLRYAMRNKG